MSIVSWTQLLEAVQAENLEIIDKALLQYDTWIYTTPLVEDKTILELSVEKGCQKVVSRILEDAVFEFLETKRDIVSKGLEIALENNHVQIADYLATKLVRLKNFDEEIDEKNIRELKYEEILANFHYNKDIVISMLDDTDDHLWNDLIRRKTFHSRIILGCYQWSLYEIVRGKEEHFNEILEKDWETHVPSQHRAVFTGNWSLLEAVIKESKTWYSDTDKNGKTVLSLVAAMGDYDAFNRVWSYVPENIRSESYYYEQMWTKAIRNDRRGLVVKLMMAEPETNFEFSWKWCDRVRLAIDLKAKNVRNFLFDLFLPHITTEWKVNILKYCYKDAESWRLILRTMKSDEDLHTLFSSTFVWTLAVKHGFYNTLKTLSDFEFEKCVNPYSDNLTGNCPHFSKTSVAVTEFLRQFCFCSDKQRMCALNVLFVGSEEARVTVPLLRLLVRDPIAELPHFRDSIYTDCVLDSEAIVSILDVSPKAYQDKGFSSEEQYVLPGHLSTRKFAKSRKMTHSFICEVIRTLSGSVNQITTNGLLGKIPNLDAEKWELFYTLANLAEKSGIQIHDDSSIYDSRTRSVLELLRKKRLLDLKSLCRIAVRKQLSSVRYHSSLRECIVELEAVLPRQMIMFLLFYDCRKPINLDVESDSEDLETDSDDDSVEFEFL